MDYMSYQKIGPTAWSVAHARSLSDIKYSKEIFAEIRHFMHNATEVEKEYLQTAGVEKLAPMFEARYKLTNRLINQSGIKQIIEIASGLTPRGLEYTENPEIKFVEFDLPEMITEKQQIIKDLKAERQNLFLETGDALDLKSVMAATKHFEAGPIAVVTEGLLRYLNFEQKSAVVKNIRSLLEKFGGFWVTPDISVNTKKEGQRQGGHSAGVLKMTGINLSNNSFKNTSNGKKFIEDFGFTVGTFKFSDMLAQLKSPQVIGMTHDETENLLQNRLTFVMKIKN
jgi:O-methyltransferase involved in polyketide biosynthesis